MSVFYVIRGQMNIKEIELSKLVPYENNPRRNDEAVEYVANSIQEFGFKVPIVIDSNNVIVCGHTRYKACKQLGIKKVPCVIADDLNEEQIKAFRLADNKVSEKAEWDYSTLSLELEDINFIDMEDFGFELIDNSSDTTDEDFGKNGDEIRKDFFDKYNLDLFNPDRTEGKYQMPVIKSCDFIPSDLIGFNYMLTSENKATGIHCYVDDYQIERLWNNPEDYVLKLQEYECVLTPDFSLYLDMPLALKIWNVYRSRLLGQYWQDCGVIVIPTIQWADEDTFDFCFDGIEKGSTVSVSTIGVKQNEFSKSIWVKGMNEMIKRIQPKTILVYGGELEYDYKDIQVIYYDNKVTERLKLAKKNESSNEMSV